MVSQFKVTVMALLLFLLPASARAGSFSLEGDAAAYFLSGYSVIGRYTFSNGFEVAAGGGKFELPEAIVKSSQSNFNQYKWEARCDSISVLRIGYRWSKPNENGFSTHLIGMVQKWNVKSETLAEATDFTTSNVGLSLGYTAHVFKGLYLYPIASYTFNSIVDGSSEVQGAKYEVKSPDLSYSVHLGYEF